LVAPDLDLAPETGFQVSSGSAGFVSALSAGPGPLLSVPFRRARGLPRERVALRAPLVALQFYGKKCALIPTTRSATCEGETPTDHLDRITGTRKQTRRIFDKHRNRVDVSQLRKDARGVSSELAIGRNRRAALLRAGGGSWGPLGAISAGFRWFPGSARAPF
jgi:hypothetical protein